MSLRDFFSNVRRTSAPVAKERLQILLQHERVSGSDSRLIAVLREDILKVIAKHMQVDQDKVMVKLDRGGDVATLEIDIEMPPQVPAQAEA